MPRARDKATRDAYFRARQDMRSLHEQLKRLVEMAQPGADTSGVGVNHYTLTRQSFKLLRELDAYLYGDMYPDEKRRLAQEWEREQAACGELIGSN